MIQEKIIRYLNREAQRWVSHFVLIGFALIAVGLIYISQEAQALGERYNERAGRDAVNVMLEDSSI